MLKRNPDDISRILFARNRPEGQHFKTPEMSMFQTVKMGLEPEGHNRATNRLQVLSGGDSDCCILARAHLAQYFPQHINSNLLGWDLKDYQVQHLHQHHEDFDHFIGSFRHPGCAFNVDEFVSMINHHQWFILSKGKSQSLVINGCMISPGLAQLQTAHFDDTVFRSLPDAISHLANSP